MSWSRIIGVVVVVLAGLLLVRQIGAPDALAAPRCQFMHGFRALAEQIPSEVGDCLEDEHHNPYSGDGLQQTTGGLLVWRKVDNHTAFTDGHRSWVNGPYGLQRRLNVERFGWEARVTRAEALASVGVDDSRSQTWIRRLDSIEAKLTTFGEWQRIRDELACGDPANHSGLVWVVLIAGELRAQGPVEEWRMMWATYMVDAETGLRHGGGVGSRPSRWDALPDLDPDGPTPRIISRLDGDVPCNIPPTATPAPRPTAG